MAKTEAKYYAISLIGQLSMPSYNMTLCICDMKTVNVSLLILFDSRFSDLLGLLDSDRMQNNDYAGA